MSDSTVVLTTNRIQSNTVCNSCAQVFCVRSNYGFIFQEVLAHICRKIKPIIRLFFGLSSKTKGNLLGNSDDYLEKHKE